MTLLTRYKLLLALTTFCLGVIIIAAVHYHLRIQARALADISLHSIADRKMAETIYYETVSRPKLIEALKAGNEADHFDPSLLSGTFITRNQQEIYDYISPGHYKVRPFAINARTSENEASELERRFLNKLNTNRDLSFESHTVELDGTPHLIHLHHLAVQEESCQSCHGTPDDAVEGLVQIYGRSKGFHRKVGQVVSGLSVSVSLQPFYAQADHRTVILSVLLITAAALVNWFLYWSSTRMFFSSRSPETDATRRGEHPDPSKAPTP